MRCTWMATALQAASHPCLRSLLGLQQNKAVQQGNLTSGTSFLLFSSPTTSSLFPSFYYAFDLVHDQAFILPCGFSPCSTCRTRSPRCDASCPRTSAALYSTATAQHSNHKNRRNYGSDLRRLSSTLFDPLSPCILYYGEGVIQSVI
jgi:hypothetical protein